METKTFTVVDTRSNSKKVFNSHATTLGELKQELENLGISTTNISIQEGLTKTEFLNDDALLPHDVLYHGVTTNNLLFRITMAEKHIKSGRVTVRMKVYDDIRNNHFQDLIRDVFGKNFTQVSTNELLDFIENKLKEQNEEQEASDECRHATNECHCTSSEGTTVDGIVRAVLSNVNFWNGVATIVDRAIDKKGVAAHLADSQEQNIYSRQEIEDIFNDL